MPVLAFCLSYLLGAVPFGVLVARSRGVDIQAVGSGNSGATNVYRTLGARAGILVFVLDVLKGLVAPFIGRWMVGPHEYSVIAACALPAVLGHTFSCFLKFKGGKGIATGLGMALGLVPIPALCAFALWGAVLLVTRMISAASVVAMFAAPFIALWFKAPTPFVIVIAIIATIAILKHIPNLKRIAAGTEPKIKLGKKRREYSGSTRFKSNDSMNHESEVAVLGAGSWGLALAWLLDQKGIAARVWAREENTARELHTSHQSVKYLPTATFHHATFTADLYAAVEGAKFVIVAVPCAGVPHLAQQLSTRAGEAIVISGTKGLHPESGLRPSEIWVRAGLDLNNFVALSGPNLSKEIVAGEPASTVVASVNLGTAQAAQKLFASQNFRVYTNADLVGVELGGALKNVVAIAVGMGDGLGFGDNAKAALLSRAWREMTRLSVALGARESTLFGLSGIGDLFATCMSSLSRNHALGFRLGRGEGLEAAERAIARAVEGVHTTRAALHLAREANVELPVTNQVAAVLFENCDPRAAVRVLMARQDRDECDNY